jgi:hypothetical protein
MQGQQDIKIKNALKQIITVRWIHESARVTLMTVVFGSWTDLLFGHRGITKRAT